MATFEEELDEAIDGIAKAQWDITEGRVVPDTEGIGLGNKGVRLNATMLYSDLADSTALAMHSDTIAAEVYKAFLFCCAKIILKRGGAIRSFDGDRIMGVFVEGNRNTNAAKAALNINYVFRKLLVPRFQRQYEVFRNGTLNLAHCTGIDAGSVLAARGGVRNNNDLVWIGRAPNIAAKLSTLREPPFYSYITKAVYDSVLDEAKVTDGKNMWEFRTWSQLPVGVQDIYRSSWTWAPS